MSEANEKADTRNLQFRRLSRNSAISLYLLSAFYGGLQFAFPENGRLDLLSTLLFALAAYCWARYDSLARSSPMLPILQMLYFLTWPIGSLIYLIFRSGWKGAGIWLLNVICLCFTNVAAAYATLIAILLMGDAG